MKEQKSRKEWIKTVAIIFLAVMLALTFFSNTIMNYSLPEVAAQYCMSGNLTNKVRVTGTVDASDPYQVEAKESRKIESAACRSGAEVTKGDILYFLEEGESEELKEAQDALENLQKSYEMALISASYTSKETTDLENGNVPSLEENQAKIEKLTKNIESLEAKIEKLEKSIEGYDDAINVWENGDATTSAERKALLEAIEGRDYWQAMHNIQEAAGGDTTAIDHNLAASIEEVRQCQAVIDKKVAEINVSKAADETSKAKANADLLEAQTKLTDLKSEISTTYDLIDKYNAVKKQEEVVEGLISEGGVNTVTAPVTGTVISMNFVAGETYRKQDVIAVIQPSGKEYTLTATVPNDQVRLISVGDEADVQNSWWYSDVQAKVTSIRSNPADPSNSKLVVFELAGEVTNGQSLTLTVGKRTASYDFIVPQSAIREDNEGKFILTVISKATPLGNRYIANRVNVNILAQDDTQCAVSGDLTGWDYVITTSAKPVEAGKQVRLKDN